MKRDDVNDTLRDEGAEAVRARHDRAHRFNSGSTAKAKPRFKLKAFKIIALSTTPNYLVKGIVPRGGIVVVWGPPKCGKSFWTFDLVMHVALGWRYRGRRVRQGAVVYCALEGAHGFRARVEAWRRRHLADHGGDVPFFLLDVPLDLVADRDALIAAIAAQLGATATDGAVGSKCPVAIVIDTLNRALIGDENKSDDMARFIRAADLIRETFGCVVIVVHHCGIANNRPRGHTSLSGADDAQIAIARDADGIITTTVEHMKDGDASAPMASCLERVELGEDDDGDPITSCIVVPLDDENVPAAKGPKLPPGTKLALDHLRELIAEEGQTVTSNRIPSGTKTVSANLWRETFFAALLDEKRDTKKKAFARAVERLQELHIIGVWSDKVWLTGHAGQAGTN